MKFFSQAVSFLTTIALFSTAMAQSDAANEAITDVARTCMVMSWPKPELDPCNNRVRARAVGDCSLFVLEMVTPSEEGCTAAKRRRGRRVLSIDSSSATEVNPAVVLKNELADIFEAVTSSVGNVCFSFQHEDSTIQTMTICTEDGEFVNFDEEAGTSYVQMGGFALGEWTWWVVENSGTPSSSATFTVVELPETKTTDADAQVDIGEQEWTDGGNIQGSSGRLYFESNGVDYACTGTAIKDNKSGRSLILTAAHCVWDDIDGNFGANVVFIPNRDAVNIVGNQTRDDIDRACDEDICGCWTASAGFVHDQWRDQPWPARLAYDYGVWVVDDVGHHQGASCGSDALDEAVNVMEFEVGIDLDTEFIHGLGYSLEHKPDFRHCADTVDFKQPTPGIDTYWMDGCGLNGGASGGPWVSDINTSTGKAGKIVSINSWSYSDRDGMGGPIIDASEARCLINAAREADFEKLAEEDDHFEGVFVKCSNRPCVTNTGDEESSTYTGKLRKLRGSSGRVLCDAHDSN